MRIHRFLTGQSLNLTEGSIKDRGILHQLNKVLRLQKGEQIELFNNEGEKATVIITGLSDESADFIVLEKEKVQATGKRIILCSAIVKRDNFEWIVQKATETGVAEIIPLHTERSVKFGIQMHRLKKICVEAAEQCGRVGLPIIREPEEFRVTLKNAGRATKYFFDFGGKDFSGTGTADPVYLFIGPEGGWSENERREASEEGCEVASLGKNTLRAETAATVAVYLAVNK